MASVEGNGLCLSKAALALVMVGLAGGGRRTATGAVLVGGRGGVGDLALVLVGLLLAATGAFLLAGDIVKFLNCFGKNFERILNWKKITHFNDSTLTIENSNLKNHSWSYPVVPSRIYSDKTQEKTTGNDQERILHNVNFF